jgi:hypothetical protein
MRKPEDAERIRKTDAQRFDRQIILESGNWHKWSDIEKDETRGRALPEHTDGTGRRNHRGASRTISR